MNDSDPGNRRPELDFDPIDLEPSSTITATKLSSVSRTRRASSLRSATTNHAKLLPIIAIIGVLILLFLFQVMHPIMLPATPPANLDASSTPQSLMHMGLLM